MDEHGRSQPTSKHPRPRDEQVARLRSQAAETYDEGLQPAEVVELRLLRQRVAAGTERVATLGGWGHRATATSLTGRLPDIDDYECTTTMGRGGFDAGVACAADLIPRERQRLAAVLHAAYTPAAVAQVRSEASSMDADSDTTWWLAACSVCEEGPGDGRRTLDQVQAFRALAADPDARVAAALAQYQDMLNAFEVSDGVPYALRDGGMQGAYLAGYSVAVQHAAQYGLWFVGTNAASLGLEDFPWAEPGDPQAATPEERSGRSGPVGGSQQFVKCCDEEELRAVLARVQPTTEVR